MTRHSQDMSTLMSRFLEKTQARADHPREVQPSGFVRAGKCSLKCQPGELVVINVDTPEEKIALVINAIQMAADRHPFPVLLVSSCDPDYVILHLVSSVGRIDIARLEAGCLTDEEWPRLTETIEKFRSVEVSFLAGDARPFHTVLHEIDGLLKRNPRFTMLMLDVECIQEWRGSYVQGELLSGGDLMECLKSLSTKYGSQVVLT